MNCRNLVFGIMLASSTVACGPRVSQWVQVVKCDQRHVVVPDAVVYVRSIDKLGSRRADGGKTDSQGNTWASFPVEEATYVQASARYGIPPVDATKTDAPANPQQPIFACTDR